tara:strand:+ start:216 stop:479 length:264 start_codon:yes stop_codon:yes gene_type:complete
LVDLPVLAKEGFHPSVREGKTMLNKRQRIKNKSGIYANYRIEFTLGEGEPTRERFFNASSEEHALQMFEEMNKRQNVEATIVSVQVD